MFHFYTPEKHQKISGSLMLSGGVETELGWKWANESYNFWLITLDIVPKITVLSELYLEAALQRCS